MPFLALNGAVLPASIKMIGESFFKSLSVFASDWPAVLSHPALLYQHSPIGRESIKTGTKADSPDGLYCSGERTLPPYAQLMGNS